MGININTTNSTHICGVCIISRNRTFIYENGQTVTLSANSQGRPTGCYEEDMVVPTFRNMPVGCGYIELNSSYKVNFLQTVYYTAKTERLCIIK